MLSSFCVGGTTVYNPAREKLGTIDDRVIDTFSGQVPDAVRELSGFLALGTDHDPLPWGGMKYDAAQKGYVVALDPDRLKAQ